MSWLGILSWSGKRSWGLYKRDFFLLSKTSFLQFPVIKSNTVDLQLLVKSCDSFRDALCQLFFLLAKLDDAGFHIIKHGAR